MAGEKANNTINEEAKVEDIAIQTAPVIKIGDEIIDANQMLAKIYNLLKKIEKAVA